MLGDLSPVKGIRHAHRNLRIGYFSQHHVDQMDLNVTAVEVLATKMPGTFLDMNCHSSYFLILVPLFCATADEFCFEVLLRNFLYVKRLFF